MYCSNCGEKMIEGAKFCSACGTKVLILHEDQAIQTNNTEREEIIKYLRVCYELEKSIRTQEEVVAGCRRFEEYHRDYHKRFRPLYRKHNCIPYEEYVYHGDPEYGNQPLYKVNKYTSYDPVCHKVFGSNVCIHELPFSPDEVRLYIATSKKVRHGVLDSSSKRVIDKRNAYNAAVDAENEKVNLENKRIEEINLKKAELAHIEYVRVVSKLEETKSILSACYEKNIIFGKYRSLVPISMILEYFISGRCQTLPEAYNKYEEELRLNIIIGKLDIVIQKLESIKQAQYMLYDALTSVDNNLKELSSGLRTALKTMSNIEENTSISAYYGRVTAENANYQSYLMTVAANKYLM